MEDEGKRCDECGKKLVWVSVVREWACISCKKSSRTKTEDNYWL